MNTTLKRSLGLVAAGAVFWATTALTAHAGLVHQYTFNDGTANDAVGTAHATVLDPGAATAAFTAGGQLDLSANTGQASNAITEDAYLDLPNLIVESAAQSGVSGALTFEWWFTIATVNTWQRIGDFSGPLTDGTPSENMPNEGNVSYMLITPNSGRNTNGIEISSDVGSPGGFVGGNLLGLNVPVPANVQQHVVAVYDKNNTAAGPGGTMALYLNGVNVLPGQPNVNGSNVIREDFNLNDLNDEDNWLGRSNWGADPVFDGAYNEFRIYDHALTQTEVTASFNEGPVPVPLPTLIVNTTTGATAIKNLASAPFTIDFYQIASAAGRLNAADSAWNSLSDQNINAGQTADFDNSGSVNAADLAAWKAAFGPSSTGGDADADGDTDGGDFLAWQGQLGQSPSEGDSWDEAGGISDNLLAELFLNGSTTLAPNEQISLGSPFRTAGAQDLTFQFGIVGEAGLSTGIVQYVTAGPAAAAPEPATAMLAVAALLGWAAKRRRYPT
jgi:hypothetical protein